MALTPDPTASYVPLWERLWLKWLVLQWGPALDGQCLTESATTWRICGRIVTPFRYFLSAQISRKLGESRDARSQPCFPMAGWFCTSLAHPPIPLSSTAG